jgi:hypothetical protein
VPLETAKPGTPGFGRNVATEIKAGKDPKQAEAIAYSKAGERKDAEAPSRLYKFSTVAEDGSRHRGAVRALHEAHAKAKVEQKIGKKVVLGQYRADAETRSDAPLRGTDEREHTPRKIIFHVELRDIKGNMHDIDVPAYGADSDKVGAIAKDYLKRKGITAQVIRVNETGRRA